jgi:hypothetical protein
MQHVPIHPGRGGTLRLGFEEPGANRPERTPFDDEDAHMSETYFPEDTPPRQRLCGTTAVQARILELNPGLRARRLELERATRARLATDEVVRRGLLTIPVIVHVVHNTDEQNISNSQIQSQFDVLNRDFRATNPDVANVPSVWRALVTDAQLEFRLENVTRTRTNQRFFTDDDRMKFSALGGHDVVDPDRFLNLWVCNLRPWLGYAQFPGMPPQTDGVVVLYTAFGTEGTAAAPFNRGRTTTHEIGHYLNLHHIWGDSPVPTCNDDDFVPDTPGQMEPNFGTPAFPSITCNNGPNGDMFMNYMDYVNDEAMLMFTTQQVMRMRTALSVQRPALGS